MVIENPYAKKRRRNGSEQTTHENLFCSPSTANAFTDSRSSPVSAAIGSTLSTNNLIKNTTTYNDTPFWKRLPSSTVRFNAASIVTVSELWQNVQRKINCPSQPPSIESYRIVGVVLQRTFHDDGSMSLLVGESTGGSSIINSSPTTSIEGKELSSNMDYCQRESDAALPKRKALAYNMTPTCNKVLAGSSHGILASAASSMIGENIFSGENTTFSEMSNMCHAKNKAHNSHRLPSDSFGESTFSTDTFLNDTSLIRDDASSSPKGVCISAKKMETLEDFPSKTANQDSKSSSMQDAVYPLVHVLLNNYHYLPLPENLEGHHDLKNRGISPMNVQKIRCIWVVIPNYCCFQHTCCRVNDLLMVIGELRRITLDNLHLKNNWLSSELKVATSEVAVSSDENNRKSPSFGASEAVNTFRNVFDQAKSTLLSFFDTGVPIGRREQAEANMIEPQTHQTKMKQNRETDSSSEYVDKGHYYYVEARIVRDVSGTNMALYYQSLMARRRMLSGLGIES